MNLDTTDKKILTVLQRDGAISNLQLAKEIALSPAATLARVKKLEQAQIIKGYQADIDTEALGYSLLCFIQVSLAHHDVTLVATFRETMKSIPEVMACYFITGMSDYLLKVAVRDRNDLEHFLVNVLTPVPGVERIQTSLVLNEVKTETVLPLDK